MEHVFKLIKASDSLNPHKISLAVSKLLIIPAMFEYAKRTCGAKCRMANRGRNPEYLEGVYWGWRNKIVSKAENKVIGSIGLHNRKPVSSLVHLKQREIGYVLNPNYWGQGIIPKAVGKLLELGFEELNLDLICCGYYNFNNKSRCVVEKSGFKYQFKVEKTMDQFPLSL